MNVVMLFIVINEKKIRPFFNPDGSYEMRDSLDISFTVDERLADGFYFANSIKMIKKIVVLCMAFVILFSNLAFAEQKKPELSGKACILMDADTGRILYEKNIDKKVYPASTTKIMTATIVLEKCGDNLDDIGISPM